MYGIFWVYLQMSLPQNVPSGTEQGEIAVFTG